MATNRTQPLEERIAVLRAEIETEIEARVAQMRKEYTGLPDGYIRADLTRGIGCLCRAWQGIAQRDAEQAAREAVA
jgi:hypothetical protein